MKLPRKPLFLVMLALVPLFGAGCGGINGSGSVSPIDFFMPGILKNERKSVPPPGQVPPAVPEPAAEPAVQLAAAQ